MRVLVCGGRKFNDEALVYSTLDKVHEKYGDDLVIIEGAAPGADTLAEDWAKSREVPYCGIPARWKKLGKRSGYERNKRMRDVWKPDACIAFEGNDGTKMMIKLMEEIGIKPWAVGWSLAC